MHKSHSLTATVVNEFAKSCAQVKSSDVEMHSLTRAQIHRDTLSGQCANPVAQCGRVKSSEWLDMVSTISPVMCMPKNNTCLHWSGSSARKPLSPQGSIDALPAQASLRVTLPTSYEKPP